MMIMVVKTLGPGSQVHSPVVEEKESLREGVGRGMRDTQCD